MIERNRENHIDMKVDYSRGWAMFDPVFMLLNDDHSLRVVEQAEWFLNFRPVSVARSGIDNCWLVSTIFIGMGFGDPPCVFETMIFTTEGGPLDEWTRRSATWDAALATHNAAVGMVEASLPY